MGFGSYDETEQEKREYDTDSVDEDAGLETEENAHEGHVEFDNGASNDELLDKLRDIKEQ